MKARDAAGIGLGLLAFCAMLGLFIAAWDLQRPKYYEDTLCPIAGIDAATVIVIDKTDPFTTAQLSALKARILHIRDGLKLHEKISIAVLESADGGAVIRPVLAICNPGRGEDASPIYQNPRMAEEQYEARFRQPFERDLEALLTPGTAPVSPIAEAIAEAVSSAYVHSPPASRHLVLISDLMEHTAKASIYRGALTAEALKAEISDRASAWLKGAEAEVVVVKRAGEASRQAAARKAWAEMLRAAGATARFEEF